MADRTALIWCSSSGWIRFAGWPPIRSDRKISCRCPRSALSRAIVDAWPPPRLELSRDHRRKSSTTLSRWSKAPVSAGAHRCSSEVRTQGTQSDDCPRPYPQSGNRPDRTQHSASPRYRGGREHEGCLRGSKTGPGIAGAGPAIAFQHEREAKWLSQPDTAAAHRSPKPRAAPRLGRSTSDAVSAMN